MNRVRCPHCDTDNPEGVARCENCDTPLTAYGGQGTGEVSAATLQKLQRLSVQPRIVQVVVGLDALIAVVGPFGAIALKVANRTVTNSEGTNYAGAAFGAVGVALTAMLMAPLGLFLLYVAWLTWTRASWAWLANAALLGGMAFLCLVGFFTPWLIVRVPLAGLFGAALWLWLQSDTREWFGA